MRSLLICIHLLLTRNFRGQSQEILAPCKLHTLKHFLDFAYTDSLPNSDIYLQELADLAKQWEMHGLINLVALKYPPAYYLVINDEMTLYIYPSAVEIAVKTIEYQSLPKLELDLHKCVSLLSLSLSYQLFFFSISGCRPLRC